MSGSSQPPGPPRIAVWLTHPEAECWNFRPRHREAIERAVPGASVSVHEDADAFRVALRDASIALVWTFEESWLDEAPALYWIATPAAGRDLLRLAPRPGLTITHGGFHGEIMAETVVGLLLAHCRGLLDAVRLQDAPWPRADLSPRLRPLRAARVTLLGFGRIGAWIGRLLRPFGARITGVRREGGPGPDWFGPEDRVVGVDELDRWLPETDYLVACLPGVRETDDILDAARLARLPASAVLVNVGRGNAVDEGALAAALREGRLAAAYLDVFREEPLPTSSPLRDCPRLLRLPHVSAIAPNYLDLFVEELLVALRGRRAGDLRAG